jgi:large subunit ribosomal protein L22
MRVSPQKARLVLDLIKGRRVEDALNTLMFTKKRVAPTIEKLLRSALENANYFSTEKGEDVDVDNLYVKRAVANDGPRMKRIEIALAERNRNGNANVATVVGAEQKSAKAPSKAAGKKPAKKKTGGGKKKKTAGAR